MPDYECSPLWVIDSNGDYFNWNIEESEFPDTLKAALSDWALRFDRTLNKDYPPDSKFRTPEEEMQFEKIGCAIWKEIRTNQSFLFDEVHYYSVMLENSFSDVDEYLNQLKSKGRDV